MKLLRVLFVASALMLTSAVADARPEEGPIRVLFLGHDSKHHDSNTFWPLLARAVGRDAIFFDYHTRVEDALGSATYLDHFDAVLLYANHDRIEPAEWQNLERFIAGGGGFVAVHCASACFGNEPQFERLLGGRFAHHGSGVFRPRTIRPRHPAIVDVPEMEAWDETYVHEGHAAEGRTILQVREVAPEDNIKEPEPWTWIRDHGKGRVFYTASGHDERVWARSEFHELLRRGILWAVGSERRATYEHFLAGRTPLTYEPRGDIPNYENRPRPLPYQRPLSPEDSLAHTQAPVEFRVELFAAEPDIVNPISLAWDERGRLWVAESVDYPNEVREGGVGNDSIKILEDRDGDGRCDHVTTFAEGLNIPTSITCFQGGVIVAQAPELLFLADDDGDGRADRREVLLEGWGTYDTHAGVSNLRYGFDNWIYGAVGYAGFSGEVAGRMRRFGSGIFRVRPDGSDLEFLHQFNNNTWGLGLNQVGDVFGSTANDNPSFFGGIPATLYSAGSAGTSARMIADRSTFAPITPNIRQVDAFGAYTAAAGHAFATSGNFPPSMRDRVAFVAGPTGNLLGRFRVEPYESGYRAKNDGNLLASADEWFSPVAAKVGPDGHVWVADWYNFIIQHNPTPTSARGGYDAETGKGNAHVNPNRDRLRGRIYRVVWEGAVAPEITTLEDAATEGLVAALGDDNLFWRLTAQRLLVSEARRNAVPALRATVLAGEIPAAIHALWTLHGLGELDPELHQRALLAASTGLRRNAIRALGRDAPSLRLLLDTASVTHEDPAVRREAFIALARMVDGETASAVATKLLRQPENESDEWLRLALLAGGAVRARGALGPNLLPNASFERVGSGALPDGWRVRTYGGVADHVLDDAVARTGERSLRVSSANGSDTSLFAAVDLEEGKEYRLTAWVRTEGLNGARGAQMNVHELQNPQPIRTEAVLGDHDWTRVTVDFRADATRRVTVNCLFGGWGFSKGVAWWDDVALQEITYESAEAPAAAPVGDAGRGRRIYHEHQIAACTRCHKLGGEGGVIGPPLDGIAGKRSRDYLLRSLVDPSADIAEGWDAQVSPMPPMAVLLDEGELADLLAYLLTLE